MDGGDAQIMKHVNCDGLECVVVALQAAGRYLFDLFFERVMAGSEIQENARLITVRS